MLCHMMHCISYLFYQQNRISSFVFEIYFCSITVIKVNIELFSVRSFSSSASNIVFNLCSVVITFISVRQLSQFILKSLLWGFFVTKCYYFYRLFCIFKKSRVAEWINVQIGMPRSRDQKGGSSFPKTNSV